MTDHLDLSVRVSAPDGWHELEDEANGYSLHPDSMASGTEPVRDVSSDGDWIDGTFTRRATRGNVTETLAIWVEAADHWAWLQRWNDLKGWLGQVNYNIEVTIDNGKEIWSCMKPAEFTWDLQQAFRFATSGLLRASVSRHPHVVIEEVGP